MRVVVHDLAAAVDEGRRSPTAAEVCVSLNGGGWRAGLWLGLTHFLQRNHTDQVLSNWSFCGTSAGVCYALALALGFPAAKLEALVCTAATQAQAHAFGIAWSVNEIAGNVIRVILSHVDESELVRRLRGRFAVCVTSLVGCTLTPFLVTDFDSKEEVFKACVGSAHIPFFSSLDGPRLCGVRVYDGGLTPDGCVPLLPARVVVHGRCFGVPERPLPDGVSVDIEETPHVSMSSIFRTPSSDKDVRELAGKGDALAHAFFASDNWKWRLGFAA